MVLHWCPCPGSTSSYLQMEVRPTDFAVIYERLKAAEKRLRHPFADRTNIYRCEDGRPICYCCLRVGHVAKYCWDRRYSCPHNRPQYAPETSVPVVPVDLESLERDVNGLLKELHGITQDLELSWTTPFQAGAVDDRTGEATDQCKETENLAVNPDTKVQEPRRNLHIDMGRSRVPLCEAVYTPPRFMYFNDVT